MAEKFYVNNELLDKKILAAIESVYSDYENGEIVEAKRTFKAIIKAVEAFERDYERQIMLYTYAMIKKLGYETVADFVVDYVGKHKNCCIQYTNDGVYVDYDFDSEVSYGRES